MSNATKLGIWMDHQNAHLIEFTTEPMTTSTVESKFSHQEKEKTLHEGELRMHNTEQHQLSEYYKVLANRIRPFEEVLLFGPTQAKAELHNVLIGDSHFSKIKITVRDADKMPDHEQQAFVKDFFTHKDFGQSL